VYSCRISNSAIVNLKTWNWFVITFISLETYATLRHSCIMSVSNVKYDGNCISGLAFMRGILFDSAFGGLSGRYLTGQGVTPFEVRWSP
jgi:hypothetical protein